MSTEATIPETIIATSNGKAKMCRQNTLSVASKLSEKYGIDGQPGAKTICPFCKRTTFSIKRDDLLGKCFHPSCGKFITAFHSSTTQHNPLQGILQEIFNDFHQELLQLKKSKNSNAYNYLIDERKIHPQVVTDSMLGAVPENYDFESKFAKLLAKSPDYAEIISEAQKKLESCLQGTTGWLCFFYTDAYHRIVAIRFREPYSKKILYFKPFKDVAGLFGHGLFSPAQSDHLKHLNDNMIVTEGEFNQLQLQSLCVRHAEAENRERDYIFACSVGGVSNADFETIRKVAQSPVICYDHDDAGFSLVERARQLMSVTAFTTPQTGSDLDDYIRSFGDNHKAAWDTIKRLVDRRKLYQRPYESIARQIFSVRQKQSKKDTRRDFEINSEVAGIIKNNLQERGKFYTDGIRGYLFFEDEKKLIRIEIDNDQFTLMLGRYSLNRSEPIYRYIFESIRTEALARGERTEVHRLAYYDPETFTVYANNFKDQIYRVSPESVDLVDNGSDGVLFLSDSKSQPFEIGDRSEDISWLDKVIISKINFAEDVLPANKRKIVFLLWFYSLFFSSIMPTKPILAFVGNKGSGKSVTARKVGMLLFGPAFDVMPLPNDVKDFDAAVTNSHYVAIDNADSKCSWLLDRLATVATGGTIKKRQLYTDNKTIEIPVNCFLAITSRNPHFRRDDVADRLLIIKVNRYGKFKSEKVLLAEITTNRNKIMTEIIHHLQEIVRALKMCAHQDESSTFRIADFADFAMKITRSARIENEMRDIFDKLTHEQSSFTLEDDPIFDLLSIWVRKNPGEEVSNAELCQELFKLGEKEKIDFPYSGKTAAFAQRMRNLRPNLDEFFVITDRKAGARKKLYRFTPREKEGLE